ncbi:lytic transglycosylase domain-containing protein [Cyclobacterium xiamenense]|uniref:lytic transglycosylase domain-containing protein n=1 Tax=Cyclobacterium xiamenense TaxID=1297121 RepID=UPI0012B77A8A|nr:lytic transglycosylase domain-containing protein [Cyclobacterium xiamenense]
MREGFFKNVLRSVLAGSLFFPAAIAQDQINQLASETRVTETVAPFYDYEHIPDFTYDEVEKRVAAMETDMPFELNETIFAFINYFTVRNRDYTRMVLARQDMFFPLFDEALEKHDMPADIKYLAIIESGLNPKARSRVGAMGLWQFMPATGKEYQLYVNSHVDDRLDPEKSTDAALRYLKVLNRRYNNWELALAAYNCGPGNVNKAIRRSGGKRTFWGIYRYLPRETRSYIPQFQAIMYVLRHAEAHNLILEEPAYAMDFDKVSLGAGFTLENLAKFTDLCLEDLEYLNPSLLRSEVPDFNKDRTINVPLHKVAFITENQPWLVDSLQLEKERYLASLPEEPEKPLHNLTYRVRSGDVLGKIAQQYGVSVSQLKSWNNLYSNTIRIGQVLHIYQDNDSFDKTIASSQQPPAVTETSAGKMYTVQPGDSLWLISRKLEGVSIDQLKKLNNLNSNQIKPGQKLIIG